jgi:hypothetical protein
MYVNSTQSLLFPRQAFYDKNYRYISHTTVPTVLKHAVAELALMYQQGTDLFPSNNQTSKIKEEQVKVGDVETKTVYSGHQPIEQFEGFRKVELILDSILQPTENYGWTMK